MRGGRLALACVLALLATLSVSTPASAVTYGTVDTVHTFVGAIIFVDFPGAPSPWMACTGSLVSARVVLTSGLCVDPTFPASQTFVTFSLDTPFDESTWRAVSAVALAPGYIMHGHRGDPHDVGVIVLADAPGITPGNLVPTAGFLDDLKASGSLVPHDTTFQVVGYGIDEHFQPTHTREVATEGFHSLDGVWLSNSMNPSLGFGGGCYDDLGGPVLFTAGQSQYIVSLMSIGDRWCRSLDKGYRVDTAESLDFITAEIALNP